MRAYSDENGRCILESETDGVGSVDGELIVHVFVLVEDVDVVTVVV